jgi:hypothetical protein
MIVSLILASAFLLMALHFMKRWFPFVMNPLQKWTTRGLKSVASVLWKKPERRSGAKIQLPRIRYRE